MQPIYGRSKKPCRFWGWGHRLPSTCEGYMTINAGLYLS
ncbi:hypothetical protein ALP27_200105 [Pseudomonas savastanoi pv. glycinea]|nr:hypothetical protein ALP27_200105 [Pseudomonas savastanoi pv. glycinea]